MDNKCNNQPEQFDNTQNEFYDVNNQNDYNYNSGNQQNNYDYNANNQYNNYDNQQQYMNGQPQYNNGQPQYNNGQPQYNNGQPQYNNGQPGYQVDPYEQQNAPKKFKIGKKNRPRRRKKRKFLRFCLVCLILFFGYKGSDKLLSNMAEKEMSNFAVSFPFTFSNEKDKMWYITSGFSVPIQYNYKNKTYNVSWESSDKSIVVGEDGVVAVTRPSGSNKNVKLSQTYKKLWGKAIIDYELVVVATSALTESDVNVITLDQLESDSYNREMQAVKDSDGNLQYMLGDFKGTYVNSAEDALTVLKAYSSQFNVGDEIEIKFDTCSNFGLYTNYKFSTYYNDILMDNADAQVSVLTSTCEVTKVSFNVPDVSELDTQAEYLIEEEIADIANEYNSSKSYGEIAVTHCEKGIYENQVVYNYYILNNTGHSYTLVINAVSGDVIKEISYEQSSISDGWIGRSEDYIGTGTDEHGEKSSFPIVKLNSMDVFVEAPNEYAMVDRNRGIVVYDNLEWGIVANNTLGGRYEDKWWSGFAAIYSLLEVSLQDTMRAVISSPDKNFNNAVQQQAVGPYNTIRNTYDWYKKQFGRVSYDGNGAPIVINVRDATGFDNASWHGDRKIFANNKANEFKYTMGSVPMVFGHEFTHAVFGSSGVDFSGNSEDLGGLNEAYCDIMSYLMLDSKDWIFKNTLVENDKEVVIRSSKYINNVPGYESYYKDKLSPETYHDENWDGECHSISVMISHIAYQMLFEGGFTKDEVANIWYNSLGLGYPANTTYVTCRKYVIQTAENLGISDEKIDFIAKKFDEREIFDSSYVFKTGQDKNNNKTSDGSTTIKTNSNSIKGDPVYDDSEKHQYIMFYSVVGAAITGEGIVLFEEKTEANKGKEAQIKKMIDDKLNSIMSEIVAYTGKPINITYKQLDKWQMDIARKFCSEQTSKIKLQLDDVMQLQNGSEEQELVNKYFKYVVDYISVESTAYDFYDGFNLVE